MEQNGFNPYQPPVVESPEPQLTGPGEQATRGSRLGAAILDSIILIAVIVPIQWMAGVFDNFPDIEQQGIGDIVMWSAIGFAIMLGINGYLLATRAQSVGKLALGIKIVTLDGQNADLGRIVLRRILPLSVVAPIPVVGSIISLIDALSIFGEEQRCLHDRIADTRVVKA